MARKINVYLILSLINPLLCLNTQLATPPQESISKILLANNLANIDLHGIDFETSPVDQVDQIGRRDDLQACELTQVVHLLQYPGCQTKAIASFACSGACPSYVQVSPIKLWRQERSCSCCQQTSLQEITFTLDCPSLEPPFKKIKTYVPNGCLCRSCTDLSHEDLRPRELVEALAAESVKS